MIYIKLYLLLKYINSLYLKILFFYCRLKAHFLFLTFLFPVFCARVPLLRLREGSARDASAEPLLISSLSRDLDLRDITATVPPV